MPAKFCRSRLPIKEGSAHRLGHINTRAPLRLFRSFLSSFLLHTYLSPLFPAQDSGAGEEEACIAQRGADSFLLSFGVVGGAIFDVLPNFFFVVNGALLHRREEDEWKGRG